MSEKIQQSLSSLMKKQIKVDNQKNQDKAKAKAKVVKIKSPSKDGQDNKDLDAALEDMTEEEILEDAKKGSKNKAAEYDQSGMIKKMIIEAVVKYTVIIASIVLCAFGIIEAGPALMEMLHGLFSSILFGAINAK